MALGEYFTMFRNFIFTLLDYLYVIFVFSILVLTNFVTVPFLAFYTAGIYKNITFDSVTFESLKSDPGPCCILGFLLLLIILCMVPFDALIENSPALLDNLNSNSDEIMAGLVTNGAWITQSSDANAQNFQNINYRMDEMSAKIENIRENLLRVQQVPTVASTIDALVQTEANTTRSSADALVQTELGESTQSPDVSLSFSVMSSVSCEPSTAVQSPTISTAPAGGSSQTTLQAVRKLFHSMFMMDEMRRLIATGAELSDLNMSIEEMLAKIESAIDSLKQDLFNKERAIEFSEDHSKQLSAQADRSVVALNDLRANLTTTKTALQAKENDLATIQTQLSGAQDTISRQYRDLKSKQAMIDGFELSFNEQKATLQGVIAGHEKKHREQQATISEHVGTINNTKSTVKDLEKKLASMRHQLHNANATILKRNQQLHQATITTASQHQGLQNLFLENENLHNQLQDYEMDEDFEKFKAALEQDDAAPSTGLMVTSSSGTGHEATVLSSSEVSESPDTDIADETAPPDTTEALRDATKSPTSNKGKSPIGDLISQGREQTLAILSPEYPEKEAQKLAHFVPRISSPSPEPKKPSLRNSTNPYDKPKSSGSKGKAPVSKTSDEVSASSVQSPSTSVPSSSIKPKPAETRGKAVYNAMKEDPNGRSLIMAAAELTGASKETFMRVLCEVCKDTFEVSSMISDPRPGEPPREIPLWDKHDLDFHHECKDCKQQVSGIYDHAARKFDFTEHNKVCPARRESSSKGSARKGMSVSRFADNSSGSVAGSSTPSRPSKRSGSSRASTPRGDMPAFGNSSSSSTPQGNARSATPRGAMPSFNTPTTSSASRDITPTSQAKENLEDMWGNGAGGANIIRY